jgi:hypothetical protein
MARTSRSKTTCSGATAPKAQRLGSTPDDIWQRNPEIIRRFWSRCAVTSKSQVHSSKTNSI